MSPALTPMDSSSVSLLLCVLPLWGQPPFSSENITSQGRYQLWEKPSQSQLPFFDTEDEQTKVSRGRNILKGP